MTPQVTADHQLQTDLPGASPVAPDGATTRSDARRPRPHACRFCQRRFVRAEHLHRHVTSHENRKPFKCQACGARYGRADVLQRHRKKCPSRLDDSAAADDGLDASDESVVFARRQSATKDQAAGTLLAMSLASSPGAPRRGLQDATPANSGLEDQSRPPEEPNTPPDSVTSCHSEEQVDSEAVLSELAGSGQTRHSPSFADHHDGSVLDPALSLPDNTVQAQSINGLPAPIPQSHFPQLQFNSNVPGPQTLESLFLQDIVLEDFPDFSPGDFIFLEDSLLPEFDFNILDHPNSFAPPQRTVNAFCEDDISAPAEILSIRTRHVTPTASPHYAPEGQPEYPSAKYSFQAIRCSDQDAMEVQKALVQANAIEPSLNAKVPTKSRISRLLNAYFEYFDPHTPIVHRPTFAISATRGPLLLAMMAVGGCYVSEHEFAFKAYEASCYLLSRYETCLLSESISDLCTIQATLLCVQVGALSSNPRYLRQAQRHFSLVTDLLRTAECEIKEGWASAYSDWRQWIYVETLSRLACWTCVLNSVILIFDPEAICLLAPQTMSRLPIPSNDGLWRASSAASWEHTKDSQCYAPHTVIGVIRKAWANDFPTATLSSFGLLAYLGSLLSYVCGHERSSYGLDAAFSHHNTANLEASLKTWERLWRRHPHAESIPSKYGDPLMADCLSLLGSAYYHLYMGPELRILKRICQDPGSHVALPEFKPQREVLKAVKYAASSWLVRAKLGVAHLQLTAALEFGGHVLVTAYEGAVVLAWWLNIRANAAFQLPTEGEIADTIRTLDELFSEIFEELRDQGLCSESSEAHPATIPLDFYCLLMRQWVWRYTNVMCQNLKNLSARLASQQSLQLRGLKWRTSDIVRHF